MDMDDIKRLMLTPPPPAAHFPVTPGVPVTSGALKAEIVRFMQANPHAVLSFTGGEPLDWLEANYPRMFKPSCWKREAKRRVPGDGFTMLIEREFLCEEGPDAYVATTRDDGTRILDIIIDQC